MKDYSQNGEQRLILEAFGGYVGRFLEIGACDGLIVSNTLALTELGWSGVMVEPSPRAFMELQKRHGANPNLTLVHAAVGLDHGMSPFWDDPTIGGYATTEEGNRAKWQHLAKFQSPFYVPLIPISVILEQFPAPIDFLSIDTEGTSTDLFLAFPFATIRPRAVCVEHDGRIDECLAQAQRWQYREVARNGENLVLVNEPGL
jgi:FkbM family methyltransferase